MTSESAVEAESGWDDLEGVRGLTAPLPVQLMCVRIRKRANPPPRHEDAKKDFFFITIL